MKEKKKNPQPSVLYHLGAAEVFLPHTCLATVAEFLGTGCLDKT